MARQRAQAYRSSELSELTRQLLYAPPGKRADVVRQAEQLHDELDAAKNYPIDFVVYRLTGRRVPPSESVTLVGEALGPDLRLLIDALSRSIALTPQEDDPGETTAELANRLNVSTKTIARWRDAGLRWRWGVREPGGKPVVLITRSALACFQSQQGGRVSSATRFSRMKQAEKDRLIARARRLAQATNDPPQAILEHLARRSGRSVETIRSLIAEHDRAHAGAEVFADRAGPLSDRDKRVIDRAYRGGVGVGRLCRRFGKTRSTIYRAIHEARARRALAIAFQVVASPIFDREDADEVILRAIPRSGRERRLDAGAIDHLPDVLRPCYDRPIDPAPISRSLVVRYNYLKHRARLVQQTLSVDVVRAADIDRFEELLKRAAQTRGEIVAGLLPVSLSVVLRQMTGNAARRPAVLLNMLDRAIDVLLEEVDRFNPARSHTLESVLTNRLVRELAVPQPKDRVADSASILKRLQGLRISEVS